MRENRTPGSARGAPGNRCPYLNRPKQMKQLPLLPILILTQFSCCNDDKDDGSNLELQDLATEIPEVELHVDLPVSLIDKDILQRIEPYPREPQSILVPRGTVNLAKGKTVTTSVDASRDLIIGTLAGLTDGNKGRQAGDFTELHSEDSLYIQVDLGEPSVLHGVWLWRKWGQLRDAVVFLDTVVQIADDSEFKDNVRTIFNSDIDNSVGLGLGDDRPYYETRFGRLFPCDGIIGRYVRVHSSGPNPEQVGHSFVEIEVHGYTAKSNNGEQYAAQNPGNR